MLIEPIGLVLPGCSKLNTHMSCELKSSHELTSALRPMVSAMISRYFLYAGLEVAGIRAQNCDLDVAGLAHLQHGASGG